MPPIGQFIRETIIPNGVSVSEAARQLGVGRPALSNLLNGNAALSREMALKLERVYGADAGELIKRQSQLDGAARDLQEQQRVARQLAAGYLKITASDIERWATTLEARTRLPVLMRRLVHADCDAGAKVDFPGYDNGERPGWDGVSETSYSGHYVPPGHAGWELSASSDLPGKPNRDIQARGKLPEEQRALTTFVFVTAHTWDGKDKWAAAHRRLGRWRDVRAYDAEDLSQWLERSPNTQVWFASEIGRPAAGVRPLAECWRRWSQSTEVELSPLLFEEAIETHRARLVNWIEGQNENPFVVVADSADEALAFLARALRETDGSAGPLHDRALVATDPDALCRVSAASPGAILIVADQATEIAAASLTRRHRVIVVRPRTSVENDADLELITPSEESFTRALADMNIDENRRDQLRIESGLSPTILRRRLATTPELRRPAWARDRDLLCRLKPMLLAGAWNCSVPADQMLVAELAGRPIETVEEDLLALLDLPEAPVWAIGSYRGLVSRKDALFTAGSVLNRTDIERFFEVAEFILSEDDPALDLAPEERWQANIHGKKRDISASMRAAVGEMLVLLAVYGERILGSHVGQVAGTIDALVSRLLVKAGTREWLSRQSDLPLLAEASPRAFLDAVECDLDSDEPQILAMLRPVAGGAFDSPDRTGLLWALETTAWDEANLFRVGRILARLSEVPIDDNWANKPENSLESLVRSWLPQTGAPLDRRIELLDMLVREYPSVAWRVCRAQIDTHGGIASPNARPRWRTDAAGHGTRTDDDEDFRMRRHALDLMLNWTQPSREQLADLITFSSDYPFEDQVTLWSSVEVWIDGGASDEDRADLREHMRQSVLSRRSQKGSRRDKLAKRRRAIFEALAPSDPVIRHRWLFTDSWVSESGDEVWDDDFDFDRHSAHIDSLRREAIEEIVDAQGMAGIGRLLSCADGWDVIGQFLAKALPSSERSASIAHLSELSCEQDGRRWKGALRGMLLTLDPAERAQIFARLARSMPEAAALELCLCAPFEASTWAAIREHRPDLEISYWRSVRPFGWRHAEKELGFIIERLLDVDRPFSAFNAVAMEFGKVEGAMLARLMRTVIQPSEEDLTSVQLQVGRIDRALDALEAKKAATVAELAQYEYFFLNALTHTKHGIRNLELQIEQSPGDFVELVSLLYLRDDGGNDPKEGTQSPEMRQLTFQKVFRALRELKRTPGTLPDGSVDGNRLLAWLVDVRERLRAVGRLESGDGQIGELLGRSKPGKDGIWPCEAIRDALEACSSERILTGMEIGLFNNRGATWRGPGGGAERTLAAKYRAFGRQVQAEAPVTARLLDNIARMWDDHAQYHDTDEAIRKRLRR